MTDALRAKEWLIGNGFSVLHWFGGSWKVRKNMGFVLGDSMIFKSDAELIAFARANGWGGEEHDPD